MARPLGCDLWVPDESPASGRASPLATHGRSAAGRHFETFAEAMARQRFRRAATNSSSTIQQTAQRGVPTNAGDRPLVDGTELQVYGSAIQ